MFCVHKLLTPSMSVFLQWLTLHCFPNVVLPVTSFFKVWHSVRAGRETQGHAREELQEVHVVQGGQ